MQFDEGPVMAPSPEDEIRGLVKHLDGRCDRGCCGYCSDEYEVRQVGIEDLILREESEGRAYEGGRVMYCSHTSSGDGVHCTDPGCEDYDPEYRDNDRQQSEKPIVYLVEGAVSYGTGTTYMRALEMGDLSGIEVSGQVWTVEAVEFDRVQLTEWAVETESTGYNSDDWATVTVRIPGVGFEGSYTRDGRA